MDNIYFHLIKNMARISNNDNRAIESELSASHYQIPTEPGRNSAIVLAGVMHVMLFLFLWVGIHWQSKTPIGVDAEIWDMNTRQAAPEPVEAQPPPPPPSPVVEKTEPPKPSPKEIEQEREAEIATERANEKKIAEKKLIEEQQKEQQKQKEQQLAKIAEQKRQELAKIDDQKKQDLAKIAEQKKAEAQAKKQHEDNLKRLTSQIAGTGDAVKSTGNNRVDPSYAGKIAAKIKSNMVYVGPENGADNPTVDFRVDLFPDGSLRGPPHKGKSSGVAAFDNAVERAITKSAPFPADKTGNVPSTIPLTYRLKD